MFCDGCGLTGVPGAYFCASCGNALSSPEQAGPYFSSTEAKWASNLTFSALLLWIFPSFFNADTNPTDASSLLATAVCSLGFVVFAFFSSRLLRRRRLRYPSYLWLWLGLAISALANVLFTAVGFVADPSSPEAQWGSVLIAAICSYPISAAVALYAWQTIDLASVTRETRLSGFQELKHHLRESRDLGYFILGFEVVSLITRFAVAHPQDPYSPTVAAFAHWVHYIG